MTFSDTPVHLYLVFILILGALSLMLGHQILKDGSKKNQVIFFSLFLVCIASIRVFILSLDPFLQDWDERFHALVAKHMMDQPFKPMLRLDPLIPYDPSSWCCNHIWVHKQPLFLWQMAASMKLFGLNIIALRLPSLIMSVAMLYFVFDIASKWFNNRKIGLIAAWVAGFSFYAAELTSGRLSLEHNDIAYTFYLTAAIWAFVRNTKSNVSWKWSILTGIFLGCAILVKWLTAYVVLGGWALWILISEDHRKSVQAWIKLVAAFCVSVIIAAPWQLYIKKVFPIESAAASKHNIQHMTEVLGGHDGGWNEYLILLNTHYGYGLIIVLIFGLYFLLTGGKMQKLLSISLLSMVIVFYSFFSFFVKTKMPAFTFPMSVILYSLMGCGIYNGLINLFRILKINVFEVKLLITIAGLIVIGFYAMKPWDVINSRKSWNELRNAKIHNTNIYKGLPTKVDTSYIVMNCKDFEDTEVMFYHNYNAYHWWMEEKQIDSLQSLGFKFAVFKSFGNHQLPEYILNDSLILIINEEIH